jgi:hypothetical protein
MRPEQILDLLPGEFDRFGARMSSSKPQQRSLDIGRIQGEGRRDADQF